MLDLDQIVGFDWDDGNSSKSAQKHAVSQSEAEQAFADAQLLLAENIKHSRDDARCHALGRTSDGRLLHITFTLRGNEKRIRVISARNANRKERGLYEQEA